MLVELAHMLARTDLVCPPILIVEYEGACQGCQEFFRIFLLFRILHNLQISNYGCTFCQWLHCLGKDVALVEGHQ